MKKLILFLIVIVLSATFAQSNFRGYHKSFGEDYRSWGRLKQLHRSTNESGGVLTPEQAAYDVKTYDLDLTFDIPGKSIAGCLTADIEIVEATEVVVFDLEDVFNIDSIVVSIDNIKIDPLIYSFEGGKITIHFGETVSASSRVILKIYYNGSPREAQSPPWGTGFVWSRTPSNEQWIGVCTEEDGGDVWFPCKDHPSDEPDTFSLHFTIPTGLTCVSNGKQQSSVDNGDGTTTFNWYVSTPINNYNVTFYISNYQLVQDNFTGADGANVPFHFWAIPENYQKAVDQLDEFENEFRFLEQVCGPFPFRVDKLGFANSSYWGMEHQTIVAYGHNFSVDEWGFDYIFLHELAHEWWGNFITAKDWSDLWIHEGMATYMEALFVEANQGEDRFYQYIESMRPPDVHDYPLAPYESMGATEAFSKIYPYYRGACAVNTLRYYLGDTAFFELLKRWIYPDPSDTDNTAGRQCRIVSTDDMKDLAETDTGIDLYPFFDVFFRQASYPHLEINREVNPVTFQWVNENNTVLDLNVPITVNSEPQTVIMTNGQGTLVLSPEDELVVDPNGWILMAAPIITSVEDEQVSYDYKLEQNYPNPFNPETTIRFSLKEYSSMKLVIYDSKGEEVIKLLDENMNAGEHSVKWNATGYSSGVYFYRLILDSKIKTMKMLYLK